MTLALQQTNTDGPCLRTAYGVSDTWSQAGFDRVAELDGDPGDGFFTVTCLREGIQGSTAWGAVFACMIPAGYDWSAGDWVVRIERAGLAFQNLYWTGIRIVRMSNACVVQEELGEDLSFSVLCTVGTHTRTITGVSGATPNAGDHIGVMLRFTNASPTTTQSISIRPTQVIDSPFAEPSVVTVTIAAGDGTDSYTDAGDVATVSVVSGDGVMALATAGDNASVTVASGDGSDSYTDAGDVSTVSVVASQALVTYGDCVSIGGGTSGTSRIVLVI